jgi:hypothetical protein
MGWISDFIYSSISDTLLPVVRPLLEDVVFEVLGERQVPTRTDFREVRDLVNGMRGSVSTAANTAKKLEARVAVLEAGHAEHVDHIKALFAQLEAQQASTTKKAPAAKKATAKKPAPRKKATAPKTGSAKTRKAS